MANLIFNGKRLFFPGGGILDYIANIIPIGVIDWDGTNDYIQLSSQPDLSGSKRVDWKMWLDKETGYSTNTLFTFGTSQNNMFAELSSSQIVIGNADNGTTGSRKSFSLSGLSGKTLNCISVKSTNILDWFSVNGVLLTSPGGIANRPTNFSRIGADGATLSGNYLTDAYIWEIEIKDTHTWSGYGSNANVDSGWVDSIGSIDGTVNGTPDIIELSLTPYTYDDWFLPSQDELNQMYINLYNEGVGGFSTDSYWSSSEASSTDAYSHVFGSNFQLPTSKNSNTPRTRVIRKFTDTAGAYSLRDTGPAGGLIFYIDSTTYYECSLEDQSVESIWSNVSSTSIGTTGTAIGDGESNTTNILDQNGFLYGSALLADTYLI